MTVDLSGLVVIPSAHGSDSANISFLLSEGNMKFSKMEATKQYWGAGETLYVNWGVRNDGQVAAQATITFTDTSTGAVIGQIKSATLNPTESQGQSNASLVWNGVYAKMPAGRNLTVLVQVSP